MNYQGTQLEEETSRRQPWAGVGLVYTGSRLGRLESHKQGVGSRWGREVTGWTVEPLSPSQSFAFYCECVEKLLKFCSRVVTGLLL